MSGELLDHNKGVKCRMSSRKSLHQNIESVINCRLICLAHSSGFWFGSGHKCLKAIVWTHGTMKLKNMMKSDLANQNWNNPYWLNIICDKHQQTNQLLKAIVPLAAALAVQMAANQNWALKHHPKCWAVIICLVYEWCVVSSLKIFCIAIIMQFRAMEQPAR